MSMQTTQQKKFVLRPTPGRIVVMEDEFQYEGLIVVPDKAQRRPTTGTVVDIGTMEQPPCKIGDKVLFAQYSGTGIRLRNQPAYRVLSREEILVVVEGDVEIEEAGA